MLGKLLQDAHIFNVLEAVSQVAKKGMVEVLEHPPFSDDISYAFRPDDYQGNEQLMSACIEVFLRQQHTFFFPNVFQRERQSGVFLLHDTNLAESTFSNHSQQTKLIQVHCAIVSPSAANCSRTHSIRTFIGGGHLFPLRVSHLDSCVTTDAGNLCFGHQQQHPTETTIISRRWKKNARSGVDRNTAEAFRESGRDRGGDE